MDVAVLFSGGADSALAALLLDPHASITLVSCRFDTAAETPVRDAAAALDLPLDVVELDDAVLDAAVEIADEDGFPRNAIQSIHEHALETVAASDYDFVADGTRRDDRTPTVPRDLAQRIEDRHEVGHLAPLAGIGHEAVATLEASRLDVETGPSETLPIGDYESELRAAIAAEYGSDRVDAIFPAHEQSRVVGRG
jgi:predicted subunit of tRNA(5-methylaminomethyl-2-thiouridylate) methyltransferase